MILDGKRLLIAGREVVPELVQHLCSPERLGAAMVEMLTHPEKRAALQQDLASVVATLGEGGAYARAAHAVLAALA